MATRCYTEDGRQVELLEGFDDSLHPPHRGRAARTEPTPTRLFLDATVNSGEDDIIHVRMGSVVAIQAPRRHRPHIAMVTAIFLDAGVPRFRARWFYRAAETRKELLPPGSDQVRRCGGCGPRGVPTDVHIPALITPPPAATACAAIPAVPQPVGGRHHV